MYWQQQQQQQQYQQNMQGRSSMRQASSGWGSPNSGGRPSLLDMSGNLRNDPGMRSPSYGNEGSLLGPGRGGTGLLPSPTGRYSGSQHDMLGQLDNDIDELVAAKVRLQQAMLSAAAAEGMDRQQPRQGYQQQGRFQNNQRRQQQQQQDRRYPASGGQRGRDGRGGARAGGGRGGDTGRGGTGGGGRFGGGGAGGGERRGGQRDRPGMDGRDRRDGGRGDSRGQNMQRKRTSSEIYDPARPTEDEGGPTSIGRPVDDLQVTIRQESRGRAVVDDAGPARKKPMQSPRATSSITPTQQAAAAVEADVNTSWVCHVCNVTCRNIKVYQTHMTGKKHLAAMEKIREVATFESDQAKARLQAQNYLRKLDGSGGAGGGANTGQQRGNQRYCRECHRYFRGERVDHIKTDAHKNAKKSSKPHCSACNLTFKTSQKYVQHCKEEMHKKRRDQQLQGELSAEEENFVTVDAVGFDDDIDLDAELIEMEINAEDLGIGPETQPQEQEEQDAVIVIDSGDDKEPSDDAEADSAAVVEDDTTVKMDTELGQLKPDEQAQAPMVEEVAEDGASAQEGIDQASTAEPVDKPSQSEVPDVQVDEPAAEQATENTTEAEKGIATKMVTLSTEGPDSESKSGLENLKVTVTFDNQPSPDIPSASTEPGVSLETKVAGADVSPGGSKMVAAVGSGDSVKASADSAQDQSDQVGSAKVSSENEGAEPTAMIVEPTSVVFAASDQQQEAVTAQQEKQEKKQPQQEEIKELVFDSNQPVGEEYLVPVSGLFCKLCHKFLTSMKASNIHCKGKSHFQALKAELKKKKTAGEASTNDVDGQSNN